MPSKKSIKKRSSHSKKLVEDDERLPCCQDYEKCPVKARACLKERIFTTNADFFIEDYLIEQMGQLEGVVKQCIEYGESNSVLVIGPRGSGKSKLVGKVMGHMQESYADNYLYVYLSGVIHTDDRLALQDIARQLELDNVVGDRVFGSFAENLAFLLEALKQGDTRAKSIVIVIDEFDLFTWHKNQALLYNFFDIAQSKQNPLCVVGITCRLDVVELLEKRVKSRYSHRVVLTFPSYSFPQYLNIISKLLALPHSFCCSFFKRRWNHNIKDLLDGKVTTELLERHFSMHKDIGSVLKLFMLPISAISYMHPQITPEDICMSYSKIHMDSKAEVLKGLSNIELCLVIAAQHVSERREGQPFNFEMVYNEYQAFAKRRLQGMQFCNKAVTFKAYEHLQSLELIKPIDNSLNNLMKEYRPMFMFITPPQIRDTLEKFEECPTDLKNWADYVFT